jgi:Glyoxalase/Bleomycin resistance protein/Dioxygenase superfamily
VTKKAHGPIMQMAYLVPDLHAAARMWATQFGVGPFVAMEHVEYREVNYRGRSSALNVSIAFAYSGDVQIELVMQHDEAPSIFSEFRQRGGFGLQHIAALTDDLDAARTELAGRGIHLVQSMTSIRGTRTALFETDLHTGVALELIERTAGVMQFYSELRASAAAWDGKQVILQRAK